MEDDKDMDTDMNTDTADTADTAPDAGKDAAKPTGGEWSEVNFPPIRRRKIPLRVLCILLAILLALLVAAGIYLLWYYTRDPAERTLSWVKSMVRDYYYREIPEDVLQAAGMEELFGTDEKEGLLDRYSAYYTAEQLKAQVSSQKGHQSGTGLTFLSAAEGMQIYRVDGNSPAEKGGLTAGLYLLGYGEDEEADTPFTDFETFAGFVSGQADEEVFYLRAGEAPDAEGEAYAVYKSVYTQNYVFYADDGECLRYTGEEAEEREVYGAGMSFLPADAAYIRLDSFEGDAAEQMRGMLETFAAKGKTDLLLDLRNNGGGQLDILTEIASMLCKSAEGAFAVTEIEYRNESLSYRASRSDYRKYFSDESRIVVLANRNTASASEALLGAMLDYGTVGYDDVCLAEIDGVARTYGKGIMQTTYTNILTGEGIKLTTALIRWPQSGNCIQGRGILPADGATAIACDGDLDNGGGMLRAAATLLA